MSPTRREFSASMIGSLVAYGFIETAWTRHLFADEVKPSIEAWLKDLIEMSNDLKDRKLTDLEFQTKMEALYKRVDLYRVAGAGRPGRARARVLSKRSALRAGQGHHRCRRPAALSGFVSANPPASARSRRQPHRHKRCHSAGVVATRAPRPDMTTTGLPCPPCDISPNALLAAVGSS